MKVIVHDLDSSYDELLAARCDRAMKICLQKKAEEIWIGEDHISGCWLNVKDLLERGIDTAEGVGGDE